MGNFGKFWEISEILDLEGNFQGKFSERNFEFGGKFRHPTSNNIGILAVSGAFVLDIDYYSYYCEDYSHLSRSQRLFTIEMNCFDSLFWRAL